MGLYLAISIYLCIWYIRGVFHESTKGEGWEVNVNKSKVMFSRVERQVGQSEWEWSELRGCGMVLIPGIGYGSRWNHER